jgi:hypothetical protein
MSWLKAAVHQSNKPKHSVVGVLRANLGGPRKGRSREVLHASDVTKTDFCPRQWALLDIKDVPASTEYVTVALDATFQMGLATERQLIEHWGDGFVYGNWRCRLCGEYRSHTKKPGGSCKDGRTHWWAYEQMVFNVPQYGLSGSVDAIFDVGAPRYTMTECKIITPDEFDKMTAPLPEHRLRTNLYMKMAAESDDAYKDRFNLTEATVLYVSRGHGKMNSQWNEVLPFREFTVQRDDESLTTTLQKAKALKLFRETKQLPTGICKTALDKTAKNCSCCKECFSGQYPATVAWGDL